MTIGVNPFSKNLYPNCRRGHDYALRVVEREIISCKYVYGACKRYLRDIEEIDKWYFDAEKAEKYLRIVQKFPHVIGKWETETIIYEDWQCFGFMNIMGFISTETNQRRFRTVHWEIPRGNGKSALASGCGLYFVAFDDPNGNQISCVATKKDQARIVLDSAREMAKRSKSYLKKTGVKVLAHKIVHPTSNSHIIALSSETNSNDGKADILSILDELHAMQRKTFDVVDSGMSKRNDSLMLCITTAGDDVEGVGHSQSMYAKKVATGEFEDDTFFSLVYTVDEGDDIFSEETWRKANPNWGVSVDVTNFTSKAMKAQNNPQDAGNFKIKHLNMWISEASAYFDLEAWDKCEDKTIKIEDFVGETCHVGIDLASKIDLASIFYIFKKDDIYYLFDKTFIPEETVKKVKVSLYDQCIESGHLISTAGAAINYRKIKEEIVADSKKFNIASALYDPWNTTEFAQDLTEERIETLEFRMNTSNLSEPTKSFNAALKSGKVKHNGNPLLRWCLGNVVAKEDAAQNVFPKKSHEKLKIDPIIACLMAYAAWTTSTTEKSRYETEGIRAI